MLITNILQIAFYFCPLVCWLLNAFLLRRAISLLGLFTICSIVCFLIMMISIPVIDAELKFEISRHDLDNDGSVSGSEISAKARSKLETLNADTGRALAPIFGLPMSAIWTAFNFSVFLIVRWSYRTDFGKLFRKFVCSN